MYWESITPIEAQELLLSLRVHDHPHATKSKRKEFHTDLNKMANPSALSQSKKQQTTSDLAQMLAGGLRG